MLPTLLISAALAGGTHELPVRLEAEAVAIDASVEVPLVEIDALAGEGTWVGVAFRYDTEVRVGVVLTGLSVLAWSDEPSFTHALRDTALDAWLAVRAGFDLRLVVRLGGASGTILADTSLLAGPELVQWSAAVDGWLAGDELLGDAVVIGDTSVTEAIRVAYGPLDTTALVPVGTYDDLLGQVEARARVVSTGATVARDGTGLPGSGVLDVQPHAREVLLDVDWAGAADVKAGAHWFDSLASSWDVFDTVTVTLDLPLDDEVLDAEVDDVPLAPEPLRLAHGVPDLTVDTAEVSLGEALRGHLAQTRVPLDNDGAVALHVEARIEGSDAVRVAPTSLVVPRHGSGELELRLQGSELQDVAAVLVLTTDDPWETEVRIPLAGAVVAAEPAPVPEEGCTCATGTARAPWLALGLLALAVRRRR